jgi:DNA (cytosine-5)-methyltransferase 1
MSESLIAEANLKVGESRGKRRVWIEGSALLRGGYSPGTRFNVNRSGNTLTLVVDDAGTNKVSGRRRGDADLPIIDLNNQELNDLFAGYDRMVVKYYQSKIVITPTRTALQKAKRALVAASVGMFVGGGLLSQSAEAAGFPLAAAVEVNADFAEVHQANHPCLLSVCGIQDADLSTIAAQVGPVGLYHAGVPCEPYSVSRRNDGTNTKVDKALPPEAHELGDMSYWNLRAIEIFNPHTVLMEEVPQYLDSASWYVTQHVLRRLGYTVDARVLNSADYGGVTARKRAVIVGTTFDSVDWPEPVPATRRLRDILTAPSDIACEWFTRTTASKSWLFDHWTKQQARGNGLYSAIVDYGDLTVGTIKKRYLAGQGDNQVVLHPADREKLKADPKDPTVRYRWLTVNEIKRLMDLPDSYYLGETKTTAGEILGQGVHVGMFTAVIRAVTRQFAVQEKAA